MTEHLYMQSVMVPITDEATIVKDGVSYLVVDMAQVRAALRTAGLLKSVPRERNADLQAKILELVGKYPGISKAGIDTWLRDDATPSRLGAQLNNLRRGGHLVNRGSRKNPLYYLADQPLQEGKTT